MASKRKHGAESGRLPKRPKVLPLLTLESQIKRELRKHLKTLGFRKDGTGALVAPSDTKDAVRDLHSVQRSELLSQNQEFVARRWPLLQRHFAEGSEIVPERIAPRLELVASDTWQADLFRMAALSWSVPVSAGYGRRMRWLVWDNANDKLVGLIALGDPVFNLRVRDEWIGWSVEDRRARLVNVMDAYVLGAVPPYNALLGGKMVACLVRTTDVKDAFSAKYADSQGIISEVCKRPKLCLVTTTSALGRSSVYNRLSLDGTAYFRSIGSTAGWGHFHIPDQLFALMRRYLAQKKDDYSHNHQFGDGPNWRLRAARKVLSMLGFHPDLLRHGIQREVFVCPIAANAQKILTGEGKRPNYTSLRTVSQVGELSRERWLVPRAGRRPEFRAWSREQMLAIIMGSGQAKNAGPATAGERRRGTC
jgi:hypothetical protein